MSDSSSKVDLQRILDSARRLGVELDENEAIQWLTAVSASRSSGDVVIDTRSGVFGHSVTMLDFSPDELDYFRRIGKLVEFLDEPGVVETALALSGSAAQSKIQTYPGDCDYFERINIKADTREEACRILGRLMREKAIQTASGETFQLIEVKLGSYPQDVIRGGKNHASGTPISWYSSEIEAGVIEASDPDGNPVKILWDDEALDPGWCKLDWVVADPVRGQLANASNMLDVTWEDPQGGITPLDGYLDPYFQEVYLEADSVPLFSKLAKHVSADALEEYVHQLEKEVRKYLGKGPNYGKAAKRMYNIFRLTGRYEEAAFVRELFDEPATALYQVWSLIRTIDDVVRDPGSIPFQTLLDQADKLVISVVNALEGEQETEIVRSLLKLRSALSDDRSGEVWETYVEATRAEVINLVNNFFHERLTGYPLVRAYIDSVQTE
ncbi:MAG: hypothetical protein E4G99_00490 [Anaerolineales bacterium]|nr:MAG: hypothetical protein E4G99_00490 [Anaerolineales bacterium]